MAIRFRCPSCDDEFNVGETMAGKRARCRKCATILTVPYPAGAGQAIEPFDDLLRVLSTYTLYHEKEKIEKSGCDPIPQIQTTLEENRIFLEHGGQLGPQLVSSLLKEDFSSLEHATGEHYGNLFS